MVRGLGGGFHIWLEASGSGRRGGGKGGTGDDSLMYRQQKDMFTLLTYVLQSR